MAEVGPTRPCVYIYVTLILSLPGVPLYSDQQTPRAPCPLCTAEKNDRSEKDLYYIDGIENGEFDDNIPEAYFRIPPVNLGRGNSPGQSALLVSRRSILSFFQNPYSCTVPVPGSHTFWLQYIQKSPSPWHCT